MIFIRLKGIYSIKNKVNGKQYIGKSIDLKLRKYHHSNDLKNNKHHSAPLQNAYNKYGKDNFEFIILIQDNSLTVAELNEIEIRTIIKENSDRHKNGYNVTRGGGYIGPMNHTEDTKRKISESLKGRVFTKEHSLNKSLAQIGGKNPGARPVSILNKKYETITEAARNLNIGFTTVHYRVNSISERFKDWYYL